MFYPVATINADFYKSSSLRRLSSIPVPFDEKSLFQLDVENVLIALDQDSTLASAFRGCNIVNQVVICDLETDYSGSYTKCYRNVLSNQEIESCPIDYLPIKEDYCYLQQVSTGQVTE